MVASLRKKNVNLTKYFQLIIIFLNWKYLSISVKFNILYLI